MRAMVYSNWTTMTHITHLISYSFANHFHWIGPLGRFSLSLSLSVTFYWRGLETSSRSKSSLDHPIKNWPQTYCYWEEEKIITPPYFLVLVLLSAQVKRFSVPRLQGFFSSKIVLYVIFAFPAVLTPETA